MSERNILKKASCKSAALYVVNSKSNTKKQKKQFKEISDGLIRIHGVILIIGFMYSLCSMQDTYNDSA